MNDALYELIVARRPKPYDLPVRILVILAVVAIAVLYHRTVSRSTSILFYIPKA